MINDFKCKCGCKYFNTAGTFQLTGELSFRLGEICIQCCSCGAIYYPNGTEMQYKAE